MFLFAQRLLLPFLLLISWPGAARAQPPRDDPRLPGASAQVARCEASAAQLGQAQARELNLAFARLAPFAEEVLARHRVETSITRGGREFHLRLLLRDLRDMPTPDGNPRTAYLPEVDAAAVMQDRRSGIPALWRVDEATVRAADRAYDIRVPESPDAAPRLLDLPDAARLEDYEIIGLHADRYSGFAALALQARPGLPRHRIYAIAGTHVFEHVDFRGWASGLTFARAQYTSAAALRMIAEAADYAAAPDGGEVFLTGQSQGGLASQGVGFLLQSYLEARAAPHRLVHVVSWGATGATEALARLMRRQRQARGGGTGLTQAPPLERHWAATDPGHAAAEQVRQAIAAQWAQVPPGQEEAYVAQVAARMRVVAYFFEIDLFARAGTFPGTAFAFPTALMLPDNCEPLVLEVVTGGEGGRFGVRLESHFLRGYRRAVERGALALARPARPAKWEWALRMLPPLEALGDFWLENIFFDGEATSPAHWRDCQRTGQWMTMHNALCRADYWQGCARNAAEPFWCLAR